MPNDRIAYIDIAKGILICCLLYGHMTIFARKEGIDDASMEVIQRSIMLYAGFFMQSFFVITGLCSSFNIGFCNFLWRNVKTLLLPAIILVLFSNYFQEIVFVQQISHEPLINLGRWFTFGAPWFIITMFSAKIMYWVISCVRSKWKIVVIVLLYLLGITLNIVDVIPNYLYHRHTLLMLPYLWVGQYWRNNKKRLEKWLPYVAVFGIISITFQFILSQFLSFYTIPTHDLNISINRTFPIHIVNALSGTASVIWISQKINNNTFLQTLGKGTLLVYLWNGLVNRSILSLLPYPSGGGFLQLLIFHAGVYLLMMGIFYFLIRLIYESKYLRWIVGKW